MNEESALALTFQGGALGKNRRKVEIHIYGREGNKYKKGFSSTFLVSSSISSEQTSKVLFRSKTIWHRGGLLVNWSRISCYKSDLLIHL